jgi:hypothetical protein
MTDNEFTLGYMGEPRRLPDGRRLRHLVADALRDEAKISSNTKIKKQLGYAAGRIETGQFVTKKVTRAIAKEIKSAREKIVDNVELISNWDD